jgi:helix-turn-helix protein
VTTSSSRTRSVPPAGAAPPARRLAAALEPVAGQVYFAREAHEAYAGLGFAGSPRDMNGVQAPDGPAYFCSRGSVLGQVPGEVVAAAFGVFNPEVVVPAVAHGWTLTDAPTICAARTAAGTAQLVRILGDLPDGVGEARSLLARAVEPLRPEGKALFAGLLSLGLPGDPVGDAWRLADLLREYRGDAHIAAWTTAGFDATEIGLLTEVYWGLPLRSYVRSRAWTPAQLDAAEERLVARGLLADGALTERGRAEREDVEVVTDRMCAPIVEALGDDLDTLLGILRPWGQAVRDAAGYPRSGPHDLAGASR